jgi:hypothetical protein
MAMKQCHPEGVKNIPDPVRAYKALMDPKQARKVIGDLDIDRYHDVRKKLGTLSNAERIVL